MICKVSKVHLKMSLCVVQHFIVNNISNRFSQMKCKRHDKKYEGMQGRLDKLYGETEVMETTIQAVETRLYNVKQEKMSGEMCISFYYFLISCTIDLQIWRRRH